MEKQLTFADLESSSRRRTTKRDAFLREMDEAVPWAELVALVGPFYHDGRRGRPPVALERVMRMYFLQIWFNLSDEGVEDACYDSRAFSDFLGVSFDGRDQVPDATTLLRFRRIVEDNGLGRAMLDEVNRVLEAKGVVMRGGSIVDATFIDAPSSTKNAAGGRDPEAHQGRKGNEWHFGFKAHVGVDAGSGLVHTVVLTQANGSEVANAHALLRPDDSFCYADAGYTGVERRPEVAGDPALAGVEWRVAMRPGKARALPGPSAERAIERRKASARAKVEHVFLVAKRQFGWAKTRYRGIKKNLNRACATFALVNLALWARAGRPELPERLPA